MVLILKLMDYLFVYGVIITWFLEIFDVFLNNYDGIFILEKDIMGVVVFDNYDIMVDNR